MIIRRGNIYVKPYPEYMCFFSRGGGGVRYIDGDKLQISESFIYLWISTRSGYNIVTKIFPWLTTGLSRYVEEMLS